MSIQRRSVSSRVNTADIDLFDSLTELALNLRWSWNHATDQLWRNLDPIQWQLTHNPWAVLQTTSKERLQQAAYEFTAEVTLGSLVPELIRVELYADPHEDGPEIRLEMTRAMGPADCEGRTLYVGSAPATRACADYTTRIVPSHEGVSVPLECDKILWQS